MLDLIRERPVAAPWHSPPKGEPRRTVSGRMWKRR